MRLNLFKSIVSILVLFASGFIIAHAQNPPILLGDCKGLIGPPPCVEYNIRLCSSMNINISQISRVIIRNVLVVQMMVPSRLIRFAESSPPLIMPVDLSMPLALALRISEPNGLPQRDLITLITCARHNVAVVIYVPDIAHL